MSIDAGAISPGAELGESEHETQALLEAARSIMKNRPFNETAREIFNALKNLTGATAGYVAMLTETGTENEVLFLDSGGRECTVDPTLPMPVRGLRAQAYELKKAVYDNDFSNSQWVKFLPSGHVKLDNVLFAPLNVEGKTVGIIGIANKPGGFNNHDLHFALVFGELAAIALVNTKMMTTLERSQERFRSVVDTAVDAIIIVDTQSRIVYWNRGAERIFGHGGGEMVGNHLSVLIPQRLRQAHADGMNRILDGGSPRVIGKTVELFAIAKDGREFPIELSLSSWRAAGETFFTGLIRDISEKKAAGDALRATRDQLEIRVRERTAELAEANEELKYEVLARKKTEAAVRENEKTYRAILNTAMDGFVVCNAHGLITEANEAYCRMSGFTREDLVGHSVAMLEAMESPEEVKGHIDKIKSAGFDRFETRHRKKDGLTIDVEVSVSRLSDDGGLMFSFVRDLTRRNVDEVERKRLAAAVAQTAESVVITDAEGAIIYVNPAFEKMTGFPAQEAIGKSPNILKSGQHDRAFYKNLWDTIKGSSVWSGHLINRRKDGELFETQTSISPALDAHGKIVNFVEVSRDISHETMLKKARDYFTAVTSHELRAPAANLQLIKALLRDLKTDSLVKQYIDNILDESMDGLNRIISATTLMEELSLTDTGKSFYVFYPYITLATSVEKARAEIAKAGRSLTLITDFDSFPKQTRMMGNQDMMIRAIDYVLSNAIKYSPDGKRISIGAWLKEGSVVIGVEDQGIGVAKEEFNHIFEPYFSLQNPMQYHRGGYSFKGGGMGLGLALCRMILEHHHGLITIESAGIDQGAKVTMTLPVLEREPAPEDRGI